MSVFWTILTWLAVVDLTISAAVAVYYVDKQRPVYGPVEGAIRFGFGLAYAVLVLHLAGVIA